MRFLITICARGGSKGIPGKNIRPLNGTPLLHYSLNHAFNFARAFEADVQLSTDSSEILECARDYGYETTYQRPDSMATDSAGKVDAIRDAWKWSQNKNQVEYDYVLDLDVTSPLRTQEDLKNGFELLKSRPDALNVFSVSPASRNPYFNMVENDQNGFAQVSKKSDKIKSRQEAPEVFDMNASFYIYTREYMLGDYDTTTTQRSLAYVMPHPCFDLDHEMDFRIMELLLKEELLGFQI
ncbi:cytidylyltransferase domain-containing protein [Roseivirga sp.]|uniref:acylneuraminate cytidylyltransferase family protein n=1 Tax=Roseivirga sp. TaxID=1964215 RepID=UPI003B52801F